MIFLVPFHRVLTKTEGLLNLTLVLPKKQSNKIMALFEEIEPPSPTHKETEKTKNFRSKTDQPLAENSFTKTKHQFNNSIKQFRTSLAERSSSSLSSKLNKFTTMFLGIAGSIRSFILNNKYLPHCTLISLGILVVFSNYNEKLTAEAFYQDFVSTGPDTEYAVVSSVDGYTSLIPGDGDMVKKQILASATEGGFVNSSGSFTTQLTSRETPLPDNSAADVNYLVRNGDTLTGLGWKFDVKLSTLKYVNNIDDVDSIRPGSKIKIPKKGYEAPASQIAKRESEKKAKLASASRNTVTRDSSGRTSSPKVKRNPGSSNNGYPYGYCTYWVASQRFVPSSWGDAKRWLDSAKRAGYQTGSTPAPGAIVVTKESWWGHVAYVESVDGDSITISEMNARGWGVTSRRTISASGGVVRGYIY